MGRWVREGPILPEEPSARVFPPAAPTALAQGWELEAAQTEAARRRGRPPTTSTGVPCQAPPISLLCGGLPVPGIRPLSRAWHPGPGPGKNCSLQAPVFAEEPCSLRPAPERRAGSLAGTEHFAMLETTKGRGRKSSRVFTTLSHRLADSKPSSAYSRVSRPNGQDAAPVAGTEPWK